MVLIYIKLDLFDQNMAVTQILWKNATLVQHLILDSFF